MKTRSKIILITSVTCMGAGLLLTGAGLLFGGFPGILISSAGLQPASRSYEPYILEKTQISSVSAVEMDLDYSADVEILSSGDGNCYLEYILDGAGTEPVWEVSSGRLTLRQGSRSRDGVFLFGTDVFSEETDSLVRLYLPDGIRLSALDITSSYGDLTGSGLSAGSASFALDYGDLHLNGSDFDDFSIDTGHGDVSVSTCTARSLTLASEYGNCTLEDMTLAAADIDLEYGNLSLYVSGLDTLNGTSEYGDVTLILPENTADYSYSLSTEYGDITLPGSVPGRVSHNEDGEPFFDQEESSGKSVSFTSEYGNISILDN